MDLSEQKQAAPGADAAAQPAAEEKKSGKKKRKTAVHVDAAAMTQSQYKGILAYLRWKPTKAFKRQKMPAKLSGDLDKAFGPNNGKGNFISEH